MSIPIILLLAVPVPILQGALLYYALKDMSRPDRVVRWSKTAWMVLSIYLIILGPLAYILLGRGRSDV